jgi:simple sugar transport system permease protein
MLAALGETVTERAGIINISLEGSIIAGGFAATVGAATVGAATGYVAGVAAGLLVGALLAVFVVLLRADQIITGTALTLLALGITGVLYRAMYGATGAALTLSTSPVVSIPVLSRIPALGPAAFVQPVVTYVAYACVPLLWWFLNRTHSGLGLRAVGDSPAAAAAAGVPLSRVRILAILFGAGMGGLAGATLVLAQAGTFAEGMSAGRGFIALAIVVLGRWQPVGVALASVVFGAAMAVQFVVQAMGWHVRYELILTLPYLLTLGALIVAGRSTAPAMLGRLDE